MNNKIFISLIAILFLCYTALINAQTSTGTLIKYSTINSIGFEWSISGDTNHNAVCLVQYRKTGSGTWLDAQPLFRVDFEGYDMLAGSIMFLDEATDYEVKLEFSDVDGGMQTTIETVTTKATPTFPLAGLVYHVIPGTSGGDGSIGNPFQGVSTAQSNAQAGDTFLLHCKRNVIMSALN